MGLIPTLNSFSVGQVISSSQFNSNFTNIRDTFNTYAVLTDTAKTISASHVWSAAQKFADGAVGTPSITFNSDTNTGLYWIGADNFGLAVGGAKIFDVASTGATVTGRLTVSQGTANTGMISASGFSLTGANVNTMASLAGTWNTSGNATAFSVAMTDTASGASSYLMQLLAGAGASTQMFTVGKQGNTTIAGTLGVAGVASFVQGNASSSPAIAFTGDANTGVNSPAADTIGLVVGGSTAIQCTSSVTSIGAVINGPNGAVGGPAYAFTNDPDCGMYRIGTNNIGLAVNGAKVLDIATTGVGVTGNLTFATADARLVAPSSSFSLWNNANSAFNQTWYDGGITAFRGVTSTTGADAGEPIIGNAKYFQGQGSSTTCYSLIGINASDLVSVDPEGRGTTFGYRALINGGAFDDVAYPLFELRGGLQTDGSSLSRSVFTVGTTNGITTAKTIWAAALGGQARLFVSGSTSGAYFQDELVVQYASGSGITVLHSTTTTGAPAARTYAQAVAGTLTLAMAAGTYGVHVFGWEVPNRRTT